MSVSIETLGKHHILKMWHVIEVPIKNFHFKRFFIHFYRDITFPKTKRRFFAWIVFTTYKAKTWRKYTQFSTLTYHIFNMWHFVSLKMSKFYNMRIYVFFKIYFRGFNLIPFYISFYNSDNKYLRNTEISVFFSSIPYVACVLYRIKDVVLLFFYPRFPCRISL